MNYFLKVPLLLSALIFVQTLKAQFVATTTANANLTPTALIQNELAGYGVSVQNVTTNIPLGANPDQFAMFTNTNSSLAFSSGVMLSTGIADAYNNAGNTSASAGTDLFGPSDSSLASIIAPSLSQDAAVLEFDFIPSSDTIRLRYVFASEEYPEYVCNFQNDPFAIYLSGPGIVDTPNLAQIPGTSLPVSINSVNPGVIGVNGFLNNCEPPDGSLAYAQYYIDNTASSNFQFDGLTTVFEIRAVSGPLCYLSSQIGYQ